MIDGSWQRQLANRLARQMGDEEWVAVGEPWEPTHCDIVVELADVVDDLLAQTLRQRRPGSAPRLACVSSPGPLNAPIQPRNPNITDR